MGQSSSSSWSCASHIFPFSCLFLASKGTSDGNKNKDPKAPLNLPTSSDWTAAPEGGRVAGEGPMGWGKTVCREWGPQIWHEDQGKGDEIQ